MGGDGRAEHGGDGQEHLRRAAAGVWNTAERWAGTLEKGGGGVWRQKRLEQEHLRRAATGVWNTAEMGRNRGTLVGGKA